MNVGYVIEALIVAGLLAAALWPAEPFETRYPNFYNFTCDGCDLRRADGPSRDEGWTRNEGGNFCPTCTAARAAK